MFVQSQVKRVLRERLPEVQAAVEDSSLPTRTAIADALCERFGLTDPRGQPQRGSCLKGLRALADEGCFTLPASRSMRFGGREARRLDHAVAPPDCVPARVDQIGQLAVVPVDSDEDLRLWNELMIREHPLGDGPLVGRQMRYLLMSEHGCLGAFGFGSSALYLQSRDRWIGWDASGRDAHLDKVVCMSRFLIRPGVNCANLASKALGMVCRSFPEDFEQRYGYRPWLLESFVDPAQHRGTCYRAANWVPVGSTCGRGRKGRSGRGDKSIKDIYVYVLDRDFRGYLGTSEPVRYPALGITEVVDSDSWASTEFGGALLGDKRLEKRLITIAETKGASVGKAFSEAARGDRAALAGFYRFIDAPDESQISMQSILQPHRDCTLRRMNGLDDVLCIHDTTDLNYSTLESCEALGVIGTNQTGTKTRGLRLHTSLAASAGSGLPLGILHTKLYPPELKRKGKKKDPRYIPIEEKETFRWITSLRKCTELTAELDDTRVIHVMDREGDFFELFSAWAADGRDELIVRAKHNRRTDSGTALFELVRNTELKFLLPVDIPRKSRRPKNGRTKAQPARKKRRATLEVRYCRTSLLPPEYGLSSKKAPVEVSIIHLRERDKPADGSKPIEWFLLTTLNVENEQQAEYVFSCYAKRWRIEEWHRALKTCCRAEDAAHRQAGRLGRILAINIVISWRAMLMVLLGREEPDLPPEILFSDEQIEVLKCFARTRRAPIPKGLDGFIRLAARLGGYLDRKNDGPPGVEILWRSMLTLENLCCGFRLAQLE
ncbi:MAG: IS4 family transposase [Phycisphaerae bacterium]